MTISEVGELLAALHATKARSQDPGSVYVIGKAYLFRLVTNYWTGRVVKVLSGEIVITEAAWIPDTGRYADCVAKGTPEEVEPVDGPVILNRSAVIDAVEWPHTMPRKQK